MSVGKVKVVLEELKGKESKCYGRMPMFARTRRVLDTRITRLFSREG
jgi:hypothetical protein